MAKSKLSKKVVLDREAGSLREIADMDYVCARTLWWTRMSEQFLWSSLQAFEKYLKSILLFSLKDTRSFGHEPWTLICEIRKSLHFDFELGPLEEHFLQRLEEYGKDRYRTIANIVMHKDLTALDLAVWKSRRYCQSYTHINSLINIVKNAKPITFTIPGGFLEKLLEKKIEGYALARERLVWQNPIYGQKPRRKIRPRPMFVARNPPHMGDAHAISILRKYVKGV
jgi:HEPN domain-containing protein